MSADTSTILLDTHVVIWWQSKSDRLPSKTAKRIEAADRLLVSPVTFWEISMLIKKGRIALDRSTTAWVHDFLTTGRLSLADLAPLVCVAAGELEDFHGDPADRMIVASAIASGAALVTKDAQIREWAKRTRAVTTVW